MEQMELTVVDLFCGAGGLSLGFVKAGFKVLLAADIDDAALATYANDCRLGSHAAKLDLACATTLPQATVIAGGPPCQGFSSAGARRNGDHRNSLVKCFAELVAKQRPPAFVFENVEGFLTAEDGARVFDLLTPLLAAGYRIHVRKVNAANYGVPQHRKRVLAIGALGFDPSFPLPTHTAFGAPGALLASQHLPLAPTVMECLSDLPLPSRKLPGEPQGHFYRELVGVDLERAVALKPGMTMRDLPEGLHHASYRRRANRRVMDGTPTERRGGAPAGVRRLCGDEPSKAITGGARSEFLHPEQRRMLTLRECASLQTFPHNFEFMGSAPEQARLIGNAVPPLFAYQVALSLKADLLRCPRPHSGNGALLSFIPTLSEGSSPALRNMTNQVKRRYSEYIVPDVLNLWPTPNHKGEAKPVALTKVERANLTRARAAGNTMLFENLNDEICSYLLAVIVSDLRLHRDFPELPERPDPLFGEQPLTSLRLPGVDFLTLYERLIRSRVDADAYFACIAKLHKARLKYERILQAQPIPTVEQVGPRGLLQYGTLSPRALAGLLFWRKWLFDIDNRAGQETGYLFEPIIAYSIGGVPFGANKSPIKRLNRKGGRQVDCIVDDRRRAYEFKLRVTIAASGQGRWEEELSFPVEARASGYTPVLVVLDPTMNEKLDALIRTFRAEHGEVFIGDDAWAHLDGEAGDTMSKFLEKYVRTPLQSLIDEAPEESALPEFAVRLSGDALHISVGDETLSIKRDPNPDLRADSDALPEDVDEDVANP